MNDEEVKVDEEIIGKEETKSTEKDDLKDIDSKKQAKNKYKEQIDKLEKDLAFQKNEYLKVFAEMENTKKRLRDEAIKDRKYSSQNVIQELINPIDMLLKILSMPSNSPEVTNYLYGFKMIAGQLMDVLKNEGLKEIPALGMEFDAKTMHAVDTIIVKEKPNIVLEVMQNGYMYKDRLLRAAMVKVSKLEEKKDDEAKDASNII